MRAVPLAAWIAIFALGGVGVACSLNPQPLPPNDLTTTADAGAMDAAPFGADAGSDVVTLPAPEGGVDAGAVDGGADAADASDAGADASDAGDAAADAPSDALDEGD